MGAKLPPMPKLDAPPTAERSAIMRSIRGRGTRPELALEAALRGLGVAFRSHARDLPGMPDVAVDAVRLAVFVDGAFWHGLLGLPRANRDWWREKFRRTRERDELADIHLMEAGWEPMALGAEAVLADPTAAALAVVLRGQGRIRR